MWTSSFVRGKVSELLLESLLIVKKGKVTIHGWKTNHFYFYQKEKFTDDSGFGSDLTANPINVCVTEPADIKLIWQFPPPRGRIYAHNKSFYSSSDFCCYANGAIIEISILI